MHLVNNRKRVQQMVDANEKSGHLSLRDKTQYESDIVTITGFIDQLAKRIKIFKYTGHDG